MRRGQAGGETETRSLQKTELTVLKFGFKQQNPYLKICGQNDIAILHYLLPLEINIV